MQDVILREVPRRSRSQPWSRRVAPTRGDDGMGGEIEEVVEKELGKGDVYTGTLSSGVPHGVGKYLWVDGCMYEGEWRNGKANGEGRFSWQSGATYEGSFRCGKMDGEGTLIGVDGDSFKGQWIADRKHGYGKKRYANGDVYCGQWKNNVQDGEGVYRWNDGNEFIGGWRSGVIHGKGTLIWTNGDRFHGVWDNGVIHGKGFFSDSNSMKRSSVDGGAAKICIWELDGEAGDITCDIIDNVDTSSVGNTCAECDEESEHSLVKSPCNKGPGRVVSKGDKNYELIMSLQVGIRHSVGKHSSSMQELRQSDFDPREKFWTRFPAEGSKNTPPHSFPEFKWKDYCPMVFRHLRELFTIDAADYLLAICGSNALREFSSPGKSGSFFYLTQDDRFMIKTIKKSEVKVLTRMLPSYYQHVCRYNNTLITKFYGLHCIRPSGGSKIRFIVMGNLFDSEYPIHKRFDLKGSSHGRYSDKNGDDTVTLKDLDFNFVFHIEHSWHQELMRQIGRDCEFLETEGIMDYSLLLGIHFCDGNWGGERKGSQNEEISMRGYHLLPNMDWVMENRVPQIRLGVNMPARGESASKREYDNSIKGVCNIKQAAEQCGGVDDVVLYFGIIDILQDYDITKKLEHAYKSLQVDPVSISAVDPKLYSKRFRDFLSRIFLHEK